MVIFWLQARAEAARRRSCVRAAARSSRARPRRDPVPAPHSGHHDDGEQQAGQTLRMMP